MGKPKIANEKIFFKDKQSLKGIKKDNSPEKLLLPEGAVIHYGGIPFRLCRPTFVIGTRENMKAAKEVVAMFKDTNLTSGSTH